MARVKFEFQCTNCPAIFNVKLNTSLNGNFRIHCPGCDHIHFRKLENGVITNIRFTENQYDPLLEDIYPMKSALKKKTEEVLEDAIQTGSGFMHRLWKERFSANV